MSREGYNPEADGHRHSKRALAIGAVALIGAGIGLEVAVAGSSPVGDILIGAGVLNALLAVRERRLERQSR